MELELRHLKEWTWDKWHVCVLNNGELLTVSDFLSKFCILPTVLV